MKYIFINNNFISESLNNSDLIAILAFITALISLVWNIVRDIVLDRINVDISLAAGGMKQIRGTQTAVFAEAGIAGEIFTKDRLLITIINKGRRPVYIFRIGGKYKNAVANESEFFIALAGLPRKLEPYEVFSSVIPMNEKLLQELQSQNLKKIWAEDTTGHKWLLSKKGHQRLLKTANASATQDVQ